jgi:hypothetical protein
MQTTKTPTKMLARTPNAVNMCPLCCLRTMRVTKLVVPNALRSMSAVHQKDQLQEEKESSDYVVHHERCLF